jgi:hypothetical protein
MPKKASKFQMFFLQKKRERHERKHPTPGKVRAASTGKKGKSGKAK